MTKFKVGDKVKIIQNTSLSLNIVGDIGKITAIVNNNYRVKVRGKMSYGNIHYPEDLELYEQPKQQNMAKDKTAVLSLQVAKLMYKSSDEAIKQFALNNYTKEELEAKELPKSWEELKIIRGYYLNANSSIIPSGSRNTYYNNKNTFPTESLAKGALALSQLLQLRNAWWDGWKPDYSSTNAKFMICYNGDTKDFEINTIYKFNALFVFKTKELVAEFLETFEELLNDAKEYI